MNNQSPSKQINGVVVEFLHPPPSPWPVNGSSYHTDINNRSLVMKLTYRKMSVLFPGDIHKEAEAKLLKSPDLLKSTLLKVPHHGSLTSSSPQFINAVQPQISLISVGIQSVFHLPHQDILERYRQSGCQIFRTDQDGAITLKTDGYSLKVETFLSHREKRDFNVKEHIF